MRGSPDSWPQASLTRPWTPCHTASLRVRVDRSLGNQGEGEFAPEGRTHPRPCGLQEQAELKTRASELRAKEDQLAAEREALERERQELRLEKERVSAAALRTRLRAEEVESMSQVPGCWARGGVAGHAPSQPR